MAGGKLEVQIGADITDFEKKIKEVEFDIKELSKVKLERLKLGLDTAEINAQIKDAKNNLTQLRTAVKDTGATIGGQFKQQTANGSNALLQFSRIAQDAPFGIIGIGNNLTATAEAFSALKNQAGSTGGALKALGASLAGSGGILLGVSLLTTGLTYLSQSGITLGDILEKLTGNTTAYGIALKSAFEAAYQDKGVLGAIENVNELKVQVDLAKKGFIDKEKVVKNYNETMGKTTGIVKDLDGVEQQLVKNGEAYIQMTLFKAVASAAQAEAAKGLIDAEKNQNKGTTKFISTLDIAKETVRGLTNVWTVFDSANRLVTAGEKNKKEAINETNKAINANIAIAKKYTQAAAEIAKANNFNFFGDNKEAPKTFNTPQVQPIQGQLQPLGTVNVKGAQLAATQIKGLANTIRTETALLEIALQEFNDKASALINGAIADTFAGLGEAIGNALASGGSVFETIGASLLSSLGSLLVQMGKMAIQVGVGLLGIKAALKSLNPAAAIGAGVALVALGSFFSAKSRSISNSIGGGGVSGSSGGGANNSSFTSGSFTSRGDGSGTVVFEIAGQKLVGVLSNTLNANRRLGGQLGLG